MSYMVDTWFVYEWGYQQRAILLQKRHKGRVPPISRTHFILVYEAFHRTLAREFPHSTVLAYVNDVAVISPNKQDRQVVAERYRLGR